MKNSNKTYFRTLKAFVIIIALACTTNLSAQPGFDDEDDVTDAPIDGGITLLLAAGAVYGIKRLRGNNNDSF